MAENLPNLKKETDNHVQEAQRAPNKIPPPKERILNTAREKQTQLQGYPHKAIS